MSITSPYTSPFGGEVGLRSKTGERAFPDTAPGKGPLTRPAADLSPEGIGKDLPHTFNLQPVHRFQHPFDANVKP